MQLEINVVCNSPIQHSISSSIFMHRSGNQSIHMHGTNILLLSNAVLGSDLESITHSCRFLAYLLDEHNQFAARLMGLTAYPKPSIIVDRLVTPTHFLCAYVCFAPRGTPESKFFLWTEIGTFLR